MFTKVVEGHGGRGGYGGNRDRGRGGYGRDGDRGHGGYGGDGGYGGRGGYGGDGYYGSTYLGDIDVNPLYLEYIPRFLYIQ